MVSIAGTYALASLNEQTLPYDADPGCCVYLAGHMTLTADAFTLVIRSRNKNDQQVFDVPGAGGYTRTGTALAFRQTSGFPFQLHDAHLVGNTITVALGGDGPGAADQFRAVFVH